MKVFAEVFPEVSDRAVLWGRSWRARGWTPRLFIKTVPSTHPKPKDKTFPLTVFNMSFKHRNRDRLGKLWPEPIKFLEPGWKVAKLVEFPWEMKVEYILEALKQCSVRV